MGVAKSSKLNTKSQEVKRKLNVSDYVFEIDGKDIYNVYVIYTLDEIESVIFENGMKKETILEPAISIELNGTDKNENDAWIYFDMKTNIDYLNTLSNKPTDITYLLHGSESFIKRPTEELSEFLDFELPKNTEEDIYKNLTSLWISKIAEYEFIMKLSVPNEVFTFFKIKFNENNYKKKSR